MMKTFAALALLLVSANAFSPMMATRAVGAKKPVKKAVKKVTKAATKATASAKKPIRKAGAAAAAASKPPPESKGYPSFRDAAEKFSLGNISGGGNRSIDPVFIHPTVNTKPPPSYDYKKLGENRLVKNLEYAFDDGLTELERRQRSTIPAFLTGSARSSADISTIREDIELQEYPFGLTADRFQLLFITVFGLFTLVGCLSGSISLD